MCMRQLTSAATTVPGAAGFDVSELALQHGAGDLAHLHGEQAAEAAARFGLRRAASLDARDILQQHAWLVLDAQAAQAVTARVVGRRVVVAGTAVSPLEHVHEERVNSYVRAATARACGPETGSSASSVGAWCTSMSAHEPDGTTTGASSCDEDVHGVARDVARLVGKAGIECRLAAACLSLGHVHVAADPLEHGGGREADSGKRVSTRQVANS